MKSRSITKKRPKPRRQLPHLCIICLTGSSSMMELSQNFDCVKNISVMNALENVMSCVIKTTDRTPGHICSICLSLLRISYDLRIQFDKTYRKVYGKNVRRENTENLIKSEVLPEAKSENMKNNREVEIIVGKENYSLSDILIVEEEENIHDYTDFLNNLGKSVTVEYLYKDSQSVKVEPQNEIQINNICSIGSAEEVNNLLYNNEETEPEEYETIVIQTVSDNDDNSFLWEHEYAKNSTKDSCHKKPTRYVRSRKYKYPASLIREINSLIIEGNVEDGGWGHQKQIANNPIDIIQADLNESDAHETEEPKRRRKRKTAMELQEIEKYIIYGTGGETLTPQEKTSKDTITVSNESGDQIAQLDIFNMENGYKENGLDVNSSALTDDLVLEALNTKNICKECDMAFATRLNLRRHMHVVHGEEDARFKNRKMSKEARLVRRIERLKNSFDRNKFLCQLCGYISKSSGGAKYHSLTHGEKTFFCQLCPKKYFTPTHLKNHYQYKHATTPSKHLCPLCGECRNSISALNYHIRLHNNDVKRFPCNICGIKFTAKGALTTHLRRHSGDRRFPCKKCNKSFFSSNELKKHYMTHTGEKPHRCKYCDKRFITTFNRKVHMLTHDGPYLCEYCHKGFIDMDMLNTHLRHKHRIPLEDLPKLPQSDQEEESNDGQLLDELELLPLKEEENLDFEGD